MISILSLSNTIKAFSCFHRSICHIFYLWSILWRWSSVFERAAFLSALSIGSFFGWIGSCTNGFFGCIFSSSSSDTYSLFLCGQKNMRNSVNPSCPHFLIGHEHWELQATLRLCHKFCNVINLFMKYIHHLIWNLPVSSLVALDHTSCPYASSSSCACVFFPACHHRSHFPFGIWSPNFQNQLQRLISFFWKFTDGLVCKPLQ